MIMTDLIPINIVIADRTYRIKTDPKDEEAHWGWEWRARN